MQVCMILNCNVYMVVSVRACDPAFVRDDKMDLASTLSCFESHSSSGTRHAKPVKLSFVLP